jgi:hypothetical protein
MNGPVASVDNELVAFSTNLGLQIVNTHTNLILGTAPVGGILRDLAFMAFAGTSILGIAIPGFPGNGEQETSELYAFEIGNSGGLKLCGSETLQGRAECVLGSSEGGGLTVITSFPRGAHSFACLEGKLSVGESMMGGHFIRKPMFWRNQFGRAHGHQIDYYVVGARGSHFDRTVEFAKVDFDEALAVEAAMGSNVALIPNPRPQPKWTLVTSSGDRDESWPTGSFVPLHGGENIFLSISASSKRRGKVLIFRSLPQ